MPSKPEPLRVLLYSHNTRGLGHAARMVSLAWGLYHVIPNSNILCCTGGMHDLAGLLPPNADFVKMPSFDAVEREGKLVLFPARLSMRREELTRIRRAILTGVEASFQPQVLIADYTPLGKREELQEAVQHMRMRPGTLLLLGLRDILDERVRAQEYLEADVFQAVRDYFDGVLVYSDPSWVDLTSAHAIPPDLTSRFIHVGYVVNDAHTGRPRDIIRRDLGLGPAEKLVILGAGGGKDAADVFALGLAAWEDLQASAPPEARLLVIGGPYVRPQHWAALLDQARVLPRVNILHHVPLHLEYVRAADLFVGACGYNTFTEVITTGTPVIFIPRLQVDSDEQSVRATQLQSKGGWQVVQIGPGARTTLSRALRASLEHPTLPTIAPIALDGARRTAEWIAARQSRALDGLLTPTHENLYYNQ